MELGGRVQDNGRIFDYQDTHLSSNLGSMVNGTVLCHQKKMRACVRACVRLKNSLLSKSCY